MLLSDMCTVCSVGPMAKNGRRRVARNVDFFEVAPSVGLSIGSSLALSVARSLVWRVAQCGGPTERPLDPHSSGLAMQHRAFGRACIAQGRERRRCDRRTFARRYGRKWRTESRTERGFLLGRSFCGSLDRCIPRSVGRSLPRLAGCSVRQSDRATPRTSLIRVSDAA